MSLKKIVLRNKTSISLNERFTFLRQQNERAAVEMAAGPSMSVAGGRVEAMRQARATLQRASAKNRRLAMQMENRPAVAAALRIKKRNMRQRVGLAGSVQPQFVSVKDRLTLSARARLGWRGRGMRARGARGAGRVLTGAVGGIRVRGGTPFRRAGLNNSPRATGLRGRGGQNRGARGLVRGSAGYFSPRGRGQNLQQVGGYNNNFNNRRGRGNFSPRTRGVGIQRGVARGRGGRGGQMMRGRGQLRGQQRGRGRGGAARQNLPVPTRDELDTQLDEYMAGTKAQLDRELDQYMNIQE